MYSLETLPVQRREAREAILKIQGERNEQTRSARPQQVFLKNAQRSMEALRAAEDSIIGQLIYLAVSDTLADKYEKMEAVSVLSAWMDHARPKQDLIVAQVVALLEDANNDLYDFQKNDAVRYLVRSKNTNAYPFLLDNIWYLGTTDDYNNFDFWYINQVPAGNWALFPEILRLMAKEELTQFEELIMVASMLNKIVEDHNLLIAILDLYAQKNQHDIFTQNKNKVVELLHRL